MKAGLKKGDDIAVSMTGSMPGANIALYAACEAMDVTPIVISSVGASQHGATDSNFTWLDMEKILYDKKIISNKSVGASLGGNNDIYGEKELKGIIYGGKNGAQLAKKNIIDNGFSLPMEGWKERKEKYEEHVNELKEYDAYVNIGGSQSSMGARGNRLLDKKAGLISSEYIIEKELNPGIALEFANQDVMLINIQNIPELIKNEKGEILIEYGGKKGETGEGLLFYSERYSTLSTLLALLLSLGLVSIVGIKSYKEINKHMNSYEAESIL
jgi:poly-gamma-glutamate system protein